MPHQHLPYHVTPSGHFRCHVVASPSRLLNFPLRRHIRHYCRRLSRHVTFTFFDGHRVVARHTGWGRRWPRFPPSHDYFELDIAHACFSLTFSRLATGITDILRRFG